jgi:diacylglycerol kinase (ATP)
MKRRVFLISNPTAGGGRGRKDSDLAAQLSKHDLGLRILNTTAAGDAAQLAERAVHEGATDVIVAGGDGTVNEALQGLVGTNVRLGVWPRGTANVLSVELKVPRELSQVALVIARHKIVRVHVGCAIDEKPKAKRYFLLMAGIGLDASIVRNVRPRLKQSLGKGAFWFSGIEHLARWQPEHFFLEVNGESLPATFASIGNAASYGGDLAITPRAEITKPEFEIMIANCESRLRFFQLVSRAVRGSNPIAASDVVFRHANRAFGNGSAPVQVDGELIGELPMRFEIAPETIDLIVP